MRVVLDTNVFLVILSRKSNYRAVFEALLDHKFELVISNSILSEYIEIVERKSRPEIAKNVADLLSTLVSVVKVEIYYNWSIISEDPDDNKFVDCAISGRAAYLVTEDKHFNVLKGLDFPKVKILSLDEFMTVITQL